MSLRQIDHFELVVGDVNRAVEFYRSLGVETLQTTMPGQSRVRTFLNIGPNQQINVVTPADVEALNRKAMPGGGHFCLVWDGDVEAIVGRLSSQGLTPRRGPGRGWGALGEGTSLFINDPDGNSVEVIVYPPSAASVAGELSP